MRCPSFAWTSLALVVHWSLMTTVSYALVGAQELHRFASPSGFDMPLHLIVGRDNRLTTAVRLTSNERDDYLLQYTPGGGVIQQVVPDNDRVLAFSASSWGAALSVDQNGQTPMAVYTAPFGQPLQEIFRGTRNGSNSDPDVSESGAVAFSARTINSHGHRDAWLWKPNGLPPQLLPDLNENQLGSVFLDGQDRYTTIHQFNTPEFYTGLYRYDPAIGWSELTAGLSERPNDSAGTRDRDVNVRGDHAFITRGVSNYTLQLYREGTGVITPIADVTRRILFGFPEYRTTDVRLGDTDEVLAIIGGSGFDDRLYDVLFRTPDGDIDLAGLLPAGESLAVFPDRPRVFMSHQGRLAIESVNDDTGHRSYHYYDYRSNVFHTPSELSGLDAPLQWFAASDDGNLYFWRAEGSSTALYSVRVPEPSCATLMTLVGLFAATRQVQRQPED